MKANKVQCRTPEPTCLGCMNCGIWNTEYKAAQKFEDVFPLKAGREMKDAAVRTNTSRMCKMASRWEQP